MIPCCCVFVMQPAKKNAIKIQNLSGKTAPPPQQWKATLPGKYKLMSTKPLLHHKQ